MKYRPGLVLAVALIALLVMAAVFAPALAPYDPIAQDLAHAIAGPSAMHPLGTDNLGRDVLSRLIWGARPALIGVAIAVATALLIGVPWGLIAGYAGGIVDLGLMRIADTILVFPGIILALVLTAVLGPNPRSTMIAIGIAYSPVLARLVRAGVLRVHRFEFVIVTRLYGLSSWHRMWAHILPNAFAPVIVQGTLLCGSALLAQAALGFLGLGIQPPFPSWGGSLSESFQFVVVYPEATLAPGLVVMVTVLAIYRIGDELRDRFLTRG